MATDPIRHIVVLMLKNHSFDQMLGAFLSIFPDLEGVDAANPGTVTGMVGSIGHEN